jgi:ADP-ribose pyrophosphatase YjhB (NUDIX family)
MPSKTIMTVCYVLDFEKNKILLGLKRKRIGKGKWNGHGGHFETKDKMIEDRARKEVRQECGLEPETMEKRGVVNIINDEIKKIIELHIFSSTKFVGTLKSKTNEMECNRWFSFSCIPRDQMWPSDKIILPFVLASKKFTGYFHYDQHGKLVQYHIEETNVLPEHL